MSLGDELELKGFMKILFLTTHLNTGGITSYILTLSRQLICMGHHVSMISSGGNMVDEFEKFGGKHFTCDIRTKSILSLKLLRAIPAVKKIITNQDIEVIHAHTRTTQFLACLSGFLSRVPYLSTCHGFFRPKLGRAMLPCWGRKVIAISEQVAGHLEKEFSVKPDNICVVRNGINLELFQSIETSLIESKRASLGVSGKKNIGIIARLSDVKGHVVLIDAMAMIRRKIPDAHLMIVGEGKEEAALKTQVARLNVSDCVSFYPVVNRTMDFLMLFDCFVLPSLQEGLGLSVMEAQAAGIPVVASHVGGIPSLIEHEQTGLLVEPRNEAQLAAAIVRVLTDHHLAKMLASNALDKAREHYSAGIMAEKILQVYEEVAGYGE